MSRGVNVRIVYGNGETVSFGKCRFQHNSEKSVLSLLSLRKFDDGDGGGVRGFGVVNVKFVEDITFWDEICVSEEESQDRAKWHICGKCRYLGRE